MHLFFFELFRRFFCGGEAISYFLACDLALFRVADDSFAIVLSFSRVEFESFDSRGSTR